MEDFDFEEVVAKIVMEAGRKTVRRDAAQQAVERVDGRAGRFNGVLLEAYGYAEPEGRGRREFDRWVASAKRQWSAMEAF
jgi:hypothetical protein